MIFLRDELEALSEGTGVAHPQKRGRMCGGGRVDRSTMVIATRTLSSICCMGVLAAAWHPESEIRSAATGASRPSGRWAELQYYASEFEELLPPEPVETTTGPFVAPERIRDGDRNETLYKLARSLKTKGLHNAIHNSGDSRDVVQLAERRVTV